MVLELSGLPGRHPGQMELGMQSSGHRGCTLAFLQFRGTLTWTLLMGRAP